MDFLLRPFRRTKIVHTRSQALRKCCGCIHLRVGCALSCVFWAVSLYIRLSFSSHLEKHLTVGIFIVSYSSLVSAIQSYVNISIIPTYIISTSHRLLFFPTTAFFSYMPSSAPFIIFGIANMILAIVSLFGLLALYLASVLLYYSSSSSIHTKN